MFLGPLELLEVVNNSHMCFSFPLSICISLSEGCPGFRSMPGPQRANWRYWNLNVPKYCPQPMTGGGTLDSWTFVGIVLYRVSLGESSEGLCPVVYGSNLPINTPFIGLPPFLSYSSPLLAMVSWDNSQINHLHFNTVSVLLWGVEVGKKVFFFPSGLSPVNWTEKRQINKRKTHRSLLTCGLCIHMEISEMSNSNWWWLYGILAKNKKSHGEMIRHRWKVLGR